MDEQEIARAEGLLHHQWASTILKIHEGEIVDPPIMFLFLGKFFKEWLRDLNASGMGDKELGQALDAFLRSQGCYIAPLPDESAA